MGQPLETMPETIRRLRAAGRKRVVIGDALVRISANHATFEPIPPKTPEPKRS